MPDLRDNRAIRGINVGLMEDFRTMRLKEESKFNRTGLIRPSTVNKEVAQLVTLMHKLVDHEKIETVINEERAWVNLPKFYPSFQTF